MDEILVGSSGPWGCRDLRKETRSIPSFIGQQEKGAWQVREKLEKLEEGKLQWESRPGEAFSLSK